MQKSSGAAFWQFIDRIKLWQIGAMAAALTVVPALIYHILSISGGGSYIGRYGEPNTNLLDALYFSVVTEATLGYGDISPFGWARLVTSVQVILGLVLAGIAVSKLTSLRGRQLRNAAYRAIGDWIEPCRTPEGDMVSFSIIYESEGTLRYDGENFDIQGEPLGTFQGYLLDSSPSHLRFFYSNLESDKRYFTEGVINSRFVIDNEGNFWNRHHSTCRDFDKGLLIKYQGYRATKEERAIIHGNDDAARCDLVQKYIQRLKTQS